MRTTLIGGLVANLVTNQRRKQPMVRLFELGRCFHSDPQAVPVAGYRQPWRLGGLAWGTAYPEQWSEGSRRIDFYDLKGDVESWLEGRAPTFSPCVHPALHPGRSASVSIDGHDVGFIGELHPKAVQKYDLVNPPVIFELDLDALLGARLPAYAELSNQPVVVRDLSLVVDAKLSMRALFDALQMSRPAFVQDLRLFDLYTGKGVAEGKKSLAFRVVMQDTQKTLQDANVDAALADWVSILGRAVGASLRA